MRDLNAVIRNNTLDKRSRSSGSPSRHVFSPNGPDARSGKVCCPPSLDKSFQACRRPGVLSNRRLCIRGSYIAQRQLHIRHNAIFFQPCLQHCLLCLCSTVTTHFFLGVSVAWLWVVATVGGPMGGPATAQMFGDYDLLKKQQ